MARGRPRKNPTDVLIRSAELIGWALGGIEREIVETRHKLSALTAQARRKTAALMIAAASASLANAASCVCVSVEMRCPWNTTVSSAAT